MAGHDVVIAGGGPTGLALAAELALAGASVTVIERRPDQSLAGTRAGGLHARSVEMLDQRGIAERFVSLGQPHPATSFGWIPVPVGDLPSRHPFVLALTQGHIERLLADWALETGATVRYGQEVAGFAQGDEGVDVRLASGETLWAGWLVGCDGGRSPVRRMAGIDFPGWEPTISNLLAEVEMTGEPEMGARRDAHGIHGLSRMEDGRRVRVMLTERTVGASDEPTLDDLRAGLVETYGTDYGVHSPTWLTRFTDRARQAAAYRAGRVLLAGDAAHIHYPTGGHGLNTGLQDAMNLGWKLARVVRGALPEAVLDTYHAERHPVGAAVLRDTMAQVALLRTDERTTALRDRLAGLFALEAPRRQLAATATGLDIRYDLGDGHPLLGRRVPDLDLEAAAGPGRVFPLLHGGEAVVLRLAGPGTPGVPSDADLAPWAGRVRVVDARSAGPWELPAGGKVPAPAALLVRPDGYVAWVGTGEPGATVSPTTALTTWVGAPAGA